MGPHSGFCLLSGVLREYSHCFSLFCTNWNNNLIISTIIRRSYLLRHIERLGFSGPTVIRIPSKDINDPFLVRETVTKRWRFDNKAVHVRWDLAADSAFLEEYFGNRVIPLRYIVSIITRSYYRQIINFERQGFPEQSCNTGWWIDLLLGTCCHFCWHTTVGDWKFYSLFAACLCWEGGPFLIYCNTTASKGQFTVYFSDSVVRLQRTVQLSPTFVAILDFRIRFLRLSKQVYNFLHSCTDLRFWVI